MRKMIPPNISELTARPIQKAVPIEPLVIPEMAASTSSARISVTIVPPIVSVTDLMRAMPYFLTIGYASYVWEDSMLPSRIEENKLKRRI